MNKAMFQARLFKDWKIIMVQSQKTGEMEPMAVNTLIDDNKRSRNKLYFDILLFGPAAEKIVDQTQKGDLIEVRGEIHSRRYVKNGEPRYSYSLRVKTWVKVTDEYLWDPDDEVPFLDKGKKEGKGK